MKQAFRSAMVWRESKQAVKRAIVLAIATLTLFVATDFVYPQSAAAYPFWAQETAPETPREATGRIVCANCHLAAKPTEVEVPQSVLPNTVFEAVVKLPYDTSVQQVLGDASKGPLNVGAVVMLPDGFKIAPADRIPEELQEKIEGVFYQPYREDQDNVIIVGPLPGEQYQEIIFPVLSPDPNTDNNVHFGKYSIHVGGNRGRGQVYPTGDKSNNAIYNASVAGMVSAIAQTEDGGHQVTIQTTEGNTVVDTIPAGPSLIISEGQEVVAGEAITDNPNVGGFGQVDREIVLQSSGRIKGLLAFVAITMLAQVFLVLKKKQIEKVQAAEMNF